MVNSKNTKRALISSALAILACVAMLIGTTFAWFTDTASTGVNKIVSGNLHVEIQNKEGTEIDTLKWVDKNGNDIANQDDILWEPGCTYLLTPFKIANTGNLALKYKIVITGLDGDSPLLDVIKFTYKVGGVESLLNEEGHLTAKGTAGASTDMITVSAHMDEAAGNDYMGKTLTGIKFTVYATQDTVENDSFGNTYDANATYYPVIDLAGLKDAIKNGGNVAVDADVEVSGVDTWANRTIISKPTTLQLNKKITSPYEMGNNETNFTALLVAADTTINAGENGGIDTQGGAYGINVLSGANLVINGGTYYGGGTAVQVQKGTATINGGHFAVEPFSDARYGYNFLLNCIDAAYKDGTAKIIVKGGTFVNFNPADCKAEGEGTNFVADGYSVISETKANGDVWYTVVKGTGVVAGTQDEVNSAIANNPSTTIKLTTAGTYTLPAITGDKQVTISGDESTVIDMTTSGIIGAQNTGLDLTIESATVKFANDNYKGVTHSKKVTYKDCTVKGLQFLYADDVEFINCEFVQENDDAYHIWTYGAKNVTFTDCKFNSTSNSKAVLCYIEGTGSNFTRTFNRCEFVAVGTAEKSAIMINPSANTGTNSYTININDCTATGYAENGIAGQTIVGVKETVKDTITVNINGKTVYTH